MNRIWMMIIGVVLSISTLPFAVGIAQNPISQAQITPSIPLPSQTPTPIPAQPITPDAEDARALSCAAFSLPNFAPYTVQAGDTLQTLIGGYNALSITQLAALNCLDDPVVLPIGAVIWLPESVTESSAQATPEVIPCEAWMFGIDLPSCAPAPVNNLYGAIQRFEHGMMIWFSDTQEIYVLLEADEMGQGGSVLFFEDTYREGELDTLAIAPEGLLMPVRGFGKVWTFLGGESSALGWAVDGEVGVDILRQPAGRNSYTTYLSFEADTLLAISAFPGIASGYWASLDALLVPETAP